MKRQIAIGDVHGCYTLLRNLIEKVIGFSPATDRLIFLGDYIDRGPQSRGVVNYVTALKAAHPDEIVLLKGNHEELAYNALSTSGGGNEMLVWMLNGGEETVGNYGGVESARSVLLPFIESLDLYYETDTHIFVHGGVPAGKDLRTASPEELLWDREFAYRGKKTLVIGHTPQHDVTKLGRKIICVDTGAFMSGVLSAYDVVGDTVYRAKKKL